MLVYHLTSSTAWAAALEGGVYTTPSLETEGFIHCSTAGQLLPVANAFYQEVANAVALEIDPARLAARLAWEAPEGGDPFAAEKFPHVYGPINLDAVLAVRALEKGADGQYTGWER